MIDYILRYFYVFSDLIISPSKEINKYIISQCINYNIGYKEFINKFLVYIIQNKDYYYSDEWMEFIDFCVHNSTVNETYLLNYFILSLSSLYNKE